MHLRTFIVISLRMHPCFDAYFLWNYLPHHSPTQTLSEIFTLLPLRLCRYCFHPWYPDGCEGRPSDGGKKLARFVAQKPRGVRTVRCQYLVGTMVRGCRCATSWCDLDSTFHLAEVTLTFQILSGLNRGNCKVQEVYIW